MLENLLVMKRVVSTNLLTQLVRQVLSLEVREEEGALMQVFQHSSFNLCSCGRKKMRREYIQQMEPGQCVQFLIAPAEVVAQGCPLHYLNLHPQTCLHWSGMIIHNF